MPGARTGRRELGQLNFDIVAGAHLVPDLTVFANGMTEDLERLDVI